MDANIVDDDGLPSYCFNPRARDGRELNSLFKLMLIWFQSTRP